MSSFYLGKTRVKIHAAFPMYLFLAMTAGGGRRAASMIAWLLLHEMGHVMCARALGVKVVEMELAPFGAAARLENVWALRPRQIALVALAGPAVNLLLAWMIFYAAAGGIIPPDTAMVWAADNLFLMLFNLIPALPLDGGRILFGALSGRIGGAKAARLGVWAGRAVAFFLLGAAAVGAVRGRPVSMFVPLCAMFLLSSGGGEMRAAEGAGLISILERREELIQEGALPVRWLAADEKTSLGSIVGKMGPRALYRVLVCDENMNVKGILEEKELMQGALEQAALTAGQWISGKGKGGSVEKKTQMVYHRAN